MYHYKAKVLKVIDSSTVELEVDLGFGIHCVKKFKLDEIELLDSKVLDIEATQKEIDAKTYLEILIPVGSSISISSRREEQCGCWAVSVYMIDENVDTCIEVNREMSKRGF